MELGCFVRVLFVCHKIHAPLRKSNITDTLPVSAASLDLGAVDTS